MRDDPSFGRWLRLRRRALDLTQDEVAQCVGCSTIAIRKLEADERRPSKPIAARLAAALQLAPEQHAAFIIFARAEPGAEAVEPLALPLAQPLTHHAPPRPSSLPAPLTRLIGREHDLAAARNALLHTDTRLLTLLGAPGIGKTRLGVQLAATLGDVFADGVYFVALAPLRDPQLVGLTIAQALGMKENGARPLPTQLVDQLRDKQLLLLLDNCEHMLASVTLISDLLGACPQLKVLATSRAALHVRGERQFPVAPLLVPNLARLPDLAELRAYAAVALFVERAQDIQPDFALTTTNAGAVAAICAQLDGLPLAIELVAMQSKLLPPQELLVRLRNRLALLIGGAHDLPLRQQTLRATLDWSYDLLAPATQTLFRRLGVFVGGWDFAAAEAVCGDELVGGGQIQPCLERLVAHSLIQVATGQEGEPRFTIMETLREYALEQLTIGGESEALQQRHAAYFVALVKAIEPRQRTVESESWLDWPNADRANILAALYWFIANRATTMGWARDRVYTFTTQPREAGDAPAVALVLKRYAPTAQGRTHAVREWQALTRLRAVDYLVPRVNLFEPDDHHLGSPFIVMEHVPGQPLWHVYEAADPATQAQLTRLFVARLIALHALDPQLLEPMSLPQHPYRFIEHELGQLRRDSQNSPHRTLTDVVLWLERRKESVPCQRSVILHRDYHPWNVLVDATEQLWVIDWDWGIGDARFDLAWTCMLMRRSDFSTFSNAVHDEYVRQIDHPLDELMYFEVLTTVRWLLNVTHAVQSKKVLHDAVPAAERNFLVELVRHAEVFLQEHTGVDVAIQM